MQVNQTYERRIALQHDGQTADDSGKQAGRQLGKQSSCMMYAAAQMIIQ